MNCKSQKTENVLDTDKSGRVTGNSSDITQESSSKNYGEPRNIGVMAVNKQSKDNGEVLEHSRIVEKIIKQHPSQNDKTPCANEQRSVKKPDWMCMIQTKKSISLQFEGKPDYEKKQADGLDKSCENKNRSKRLRRRKNGESITEKSQKTECVLDADESGRVIENRSNIAPSLSSNIADSQCKNQVMVIGEQEQNVGDVSKLWKLVAKLRKPRVGRSNDVVTCAKEQRQVNKPDQIKSNHTEKSFSVRFERKADFEKKPADALKPSKNTPINKSSVMSKSNSLRKLNSHVKAILNEMTSQNITVLSKNFAALPVDTIECLEKTVDLVFEKAIQNQSFAWLCAVLCSASQSISVTCENNKVTTSFQAHILRKCQSSFEADKAQRMDSVKKLADIKSCRNYNQLKTSSLEYCIASLGSQRSESSLECLRSLLKTIGKEFEQCCNLNETLDTLKTLMSEISISSSMRLMIQEIMDMQNR